MPANITRAPPRYVITITGRTDLPIRPDQWPSVHYLLERLLTGETVALIELERFGLNVTVEEDCDQGED